MFLLAALVILQGENPGYEPLAQALRRMTPHPDRVAQVHDLVIHRAGIQFHLVDGALTLLTPVGGQTIGAVYTGAATIQLDPPLAVERARLQRLLGDSVLHGSLDALVFVFADSTLAELERRLTFRTGTAGGRASAQTQDALDFLIDRRTVATTLMTAVLNGERNGYFAAYAEPTLLHDALLLEVDPAEAEQVRVVRRGRFTGQHTQTVSQFAVDSGGRYPLKLEQYTIDATIRGNLELRASAAMRFTARAFGGPWARLILYSELDVDSVLTGPGTPTAFYRRHGSSELWVRLGAAFRPGEQVALRVVYHGGILSRGSLIARMMPPWMDRSRPGAVAALDSWLFIKSTSTWYPRYDIWQNADVDLTFHTPAKYRFASIGRLAESHTEQGVQTSHWVSELPTNQVSFNLGEFEEFQINDPRIPSVTVHINAEAHRYMSTLFVIRQADPQEQVAGDVASSLAFFRSVYGEPLFKRYYATEIPYLHGQAFPGMIHLSWWTFQTPTNSGSEESFRAHEMAHQWWGIGVAPAGYRDAWLAEGFSEFSSLWYMQLVLKDNQRYFKRLRESADRLRRSAADAPPLALGYRAVETDPEDYFTVTYEKGAWVLHMLRNLMIDYRTMDERPFQATMREFYERYRGHTASTSDFEAVVERHAGMSMRWFFEQWVENSAIPRYTWSWTADSTTTGFVLRVRVRQSGVPDSFVMPVPLQIDFPDGRGTLVRLNVRGPVTNAELQVSIRPQHLEFNPLQSVLAEVKEEAFEP